MRLLNISSGRLELFDSVEVAPPYAILSHTWGEREITFEDIESLNQSELQKCKGYKKIFNAATIARTHSLSYLWVDTCCINKSSSDELTEAINSMFRWYKNARTCYAYLSDVEIYSVADESTVCSAFAESRWFTRGWTLQELLAPRNVIFYDKQWSWLGTKQELQQGISQVTGIPRQVLEDSNKLVKLSAPQKLDWAARRRTTRTEDMAYCLLGIFGISMPILYGEGNWAFCRLQYEILKITHNVPLLEWSNNGKRFRDVLGKSAQDFLEADSFSFFEDTGSNGLYQEKQSVFTMPSSMPALSGCCDEKDECNATVNKGIAFRKENDIGDKEPQVLAWVTAVQEKRNDGKREHLGVRTLLDGMEHPKSRSLGAPENNDAHTLLNSNMSLRPSTIIGSERRSLGIQPTVSDVQIDQDEERTAPTIDEDNDEFQSEFSDSDSGSCSTYSADSENIGNETLYDIFIEVLVETIMERKGLSSHFCGGKISSYAKLAGAADNAIQVAVDRRHEEAVMLTNTGDIGTAKVEGQRALPAALGRSHGLMAKLPAEKDGRGTSQCVKANAYDAVPEGGKGLRIKRRRIY